MQQPSQVQSCGRVQRVTRNILQLVAKESVPESMACLVPNMLHIFSLFSADLHKFLISLLYIWVSNITSWFCDIVRYIWGRMQNEFPGSKESALIQRDFIKYSNRILQSCKHDVFMGLGAVCGWDAWQTDLSEVEVTSLRIVHAQNL